MTVLQAANSQFGGPSAERVKAEALIQVAAADLGIGVKLIAPQTLRVHVLHIPLLAGRAFSENDTSSSQRVAIVNESFARKFMGKTDVVGRHIRSGSDTCLIIGVVGDVTKKPGLISAPLSSEVTFYVPAAQVDQRALGLLHTWFQPSWIVRTRGPIAGLTESMQKAMAAVDPQLPIAAFHSLSDLQALALRQQRFEVFLLGALAALALLLSLVGVYGLVSNMVAQRSGEIGIRMALGSSVRQALWKWEARGSWPSRWDWPEDWRYPLSLSV